MRVRVVEPDPTWPEAFEREAASIRALMRRPPVAIEHIGSTSVPGLRAKPVIDILLEVSRLESLDDEPFEDLGYERMGAYGIPGRRYFRKGGDARTHHVHAFATGDHGLVRHLAFRDYLRAHPMVVASYGDLKCALAESCPDIEAYMEGKHEFVSEHEKLALEWASDAGRDAPVVRGRDR